MLDYIVVGLGLAGISFCERLERNNKSFVAVSDNSQTSSIVAGGLYNPVILKRFTLAWKAQEQLEKAIPFYQGLEEKLKIKLDFKVPVLRRFASVEEQNLWYEAADQKVLSSFLSTRLVQNENPMVDAPFSFGEVLGTGRIDTATLLKSYANYLMEQQLFLEETFDYNALKISKEHVEYKSIEARQIVFAEGFGIKHNPYFKYLPLNGTKGELLTIKAPALLESRVIKSSVFIIPLGDDLYRVGATYKWQDKSNIPTQEAKSELLQKLDTFLTCNYEVVNHVAGIRPTVADRRPLVGRHPEHGNLYVLNGFGSRGVMIAPFAAEQLFAAIKQKEPISEEMDISRFTKKYFERSD
ncbi:NAD(P)/FAD-dependent oxidoreductase [Ulvibacterium marinum]|uniref:NAD(P)/FAD-dependent oxidoreductase n=1 Tax=Ulvibacterium marinum TaxID=2419782 RepID=UPI0024952AEE|nr:FAD-dependent oxidoreductase [Ulvibacterium marinum]